MHRKAYDTLRVLTMTAHFARFFECLVLTNVFALSLRRYCLQ
jgi:hypothetical protein